MFPIAGSPRPPRSPGSAPSAAPAGNCVGPNQEVGESGRRRGEGGEGRCNVLLGTLLALLTELGPRSVGTLEPLEGVKGRLSAAGNIGIQCILDEGQSTGAGGRRGEVLR